MTYRDLFQPLPFCDSVILCNVYLDIIQQK